MGGTPNLGTQQFYIIDTTVIVVLGWYKEALIASYKNFGFVASPIDHKMYLPCTLRTKSSFEVAIFDF